ncbi:MAG: guanylate kinase [Deltaproteobacteria bacterium]|nr:guanylate kinase [Deltaproteobacteria bacterium]
MSRRTSKTPLPRLIILSAPSGAGKTTLCERLLKEFPTVQLSISTTTRPQRPNETQGVHYFFVTPDEFKAQQTAGNFAEWAEVHRNFYGSSREQIEKALTNGKHVLFDIDVQGAKSLQKAYGDRVLLIFIHPPSMKELEKRLVDRKGDSPQAIETRLRNAYNEVEWSRIFDYQILNDQLDRAYKELQSIFRKECQ